MQLLRVEFRGPSLVERLKDTGFTSPVARSTSLTCYRTILIRGGYLFSLIYHESFHRIEDNALFYGSASLVMEKDR